MKTVTVIGAGIGGLAAAAVLARAGFDVSVHEAHVYPGGCAGTFYHQGYYFDAGATLAGGFYPGGPMDLLAQAAGIHEWPSRASNHIMNVHLPDNEIVPVWANENRITVYKQVFGSSGAAFWDWQERTADIMWDLALRLPPWPVQTPSQLIDLVESATSWSFHNARQISPSFILDSSRSIQHHLKQTTINLRQFIDAQLLISSQTTSQHANALYGAAALDLPRRGVVHLQGGMGAIANKLVSAIRNNGGNVYFRHEITKLQLHPQKPALLSTRHGDTFSADLVLVNLPPWNIARLISGDLPKALRQLPSLPRDSWGAFMLYLGVDAGIFFRNEVLHHQVVVSEPLGEGNSVFISASPDWDTMRAPPGRRAVTISTHTQLDKWWDLYQHDRAGYENKKLQYTEKLLNAAEQALPGISQSTDLVLPGTPRYFPALYSPPSRLGRGIPANRPVPLLGTALITAPVDGW